MLKEAIINLQSKFMSSDEVEAYRHLVPRQVSIQYKIDHGMYIAFVDMVDNSKIKGLLITEGKTEQELNRNLNQLIYMNANVPEKVRPHFGNMFAFKINDNLAKSGELVLSRA